MSRTSIVFACAFVWVACGGVDAPTQQDAEPAPDLATLAIVASGSGGGTVSSASGIDCGDDCSEALALGTSVTLTATADSGSTFIGWSGGGCSGTDDCTVTVDGDLAIAANFAADNELTVALVGAGMVTSSPGGIMCAGDCSEVYASGTVVTLTATAQPSSSFTGWSGACSGNGQCVVTIDQARAVTATFAINSHALDVVLVGSGDGTVTSTTTGIDCGVDCTETYTYGTSVTLTATAATGSTFAGWSGGGCTGTADCVVSIMAATEVMATFTSDTYAVAVMRGGTGNGAVVSVPAGIDCRNGVLDCDETYDYGTVVTLIATPSTGSAFIGWSGGVCTGTGPCTVTVIGVVGVTATFNLTPHTLSVLKAGTGTGTVTGTGNLINCGSDCSEILDYGSSYQLTASPTPGHVFTGWSGGGCTGTGTCTVLVTQATEVTATFSNCPSGSTTFNYTGGLQTFTVPACVTSITIDAYGAQGGAAVGENGTQPYAGGLGARARGTFAVTGGQVITVLVGGAGGSATPPPNASCGAGGGGGSFAVRSGAALVIAGGGGGGFHCNYYGGAAGGGGLTTTAGGAGIPATGGASGTPQPGHPGGTAGGGGRGYFGGGGGGFTGAGISDTIAAGGGGVYPGAGGTHSGGYGGGGGRYDWCCGGSGGGGGYSGGSGGTLDGCAGGGGGSINNGTSQINTAATRSGNGVVIITY